LIRIYEKAPKIYFLGFVALFVIEFLGAKGKNCVDYCVIPFEYYTNWTILAFIIGVPTSLYFGFKSKLRQK